MFIMPKVQEKLHENEAWVSDVELFAVRGCNYQCSHTAV